MTTDKVYKKQLEAFGIESVRVTRGDIEKKMREENKEATAVVIKQLMDSIRGRQWMYNLLDLCGVFSSPFVAGQPDVSDMLAGVQIVGQKFLADIMISCPEQFHVMSQEAHARLANAPVQDNSDLV